MILSLAAQLAIVAINFRTEDPHCVAATKDCEQFGRRRKAQRQRMGLVDTSVNSVLDDVRHEADKHVSKMNLGTTA